MSTDNMNDWMSRYEQQRQEQRQNSVENVREWLPRLREAGITSVVVEYNGYGDSGEVENLSYFRGGEALDNPGWDNNVEESCGDAMQEFTYAHLPGGWEINEGSYGQMEIFTRGAAKLHHNNRYEESDYSSEEYFFTEDEDLRQELADMLMQAPLPEENSLGRLGVYPLLPADAARGNSTFNIQILVTANLPMDQWDEDDQVAMPIGQYMFREEAVSVEAAMERALNKLHAMVPISNLECFLISPELITGDDEQLAQARQWRQAQQARHASPPVNVADRQRKDSVNQRNHRKVTLNAPLSSRDLQSEEARREDGGLPTDP